MKKYIVILIALAIRFVPVQAEEGITFFKGTFNDAITKAKAENKLVFIDCFTTWCGPCKRMASHVFTEASVAEYFNKNFICLALDMEKGEGLDVAKKYAVKNYPTFLWIDGYGTQIHRSVGSVDAEKFIHIAGNALNRQGNLAYLKKEYQDGNKKPALLLSYASALKDAYDMNYQTVADEYFRTQKANELVNEMNWKNILEFTPNINSYVYNIIASMPEPFYDRYGKDSVKHVLDDLALESLSFAKQQKDSALLKKSIAQLKKSGDPEVIKEAAKGELGYFKGNKDFDKFSALAHEYVAKYFMNDANELNAICWTYFMSVSDKAKLTEAETWIAQSVKLDDKYANTDTYANLLHKLGKNKEAVEMTNHSIELAKKEGEDYSSTQDLLNELQKGK